MADGGFDPCECVWSHEHAMQRLISLLRNSQGYCTDSECFPETPGPQGVPSTGSEFYFMLFLLGWLLIAVVLYFLRPNSLRGRTTTKPSDQGPNYRPPPNAPIQ
ncbi:small integral membrane protein 14-like [Limulus polyphemus]|uniref:Small integral membrane protein 14 n=1 Tax=Limulus polyphemus TaxID=6850 RepID=A0ABM1BIA2_LIMPO|nr:small integral membrane protein 14-like [Limulus polyphemus]